jgi:hypothetical protein
MTNRIIGENSKKPIRVEVELMSHQLITALKFAGYDVEGYEIKKARYDTMENTGLEVLTVLLELKDEVGE